MQVDIKDIEHSFRFLDRIDLQEVQSSYKNIFSFFYERYQLSTDEIAILLALFYYQVRSKSSKFVIEARAFYNFYKMNQDDCLTVLTTFSSLQEKQILDAFYPNIIISKTMLDDLPNQKKQAMLRDSLFSLKSNMDYDNIYYVIDYMAEIFDNSNFKLDNNLYEQYLKAIKTHSTKALKIYDLLHQLDDIELKLLFFLMHEKIKEDKRDEHIYITEFIDFCGFDTAAKIDLYNRFASRKLLLLQKDIIKPESFNAIEFSKKTYQDILGIHYEEEYNLKSVKSKKTGFKSKRLRQLKAKNLAQELFLADNLQTQLMDIQAILSKQNYKSIRSNLKAAKMPLSFNVIFHGQPGTGKTASVYNLAHKVKRDVLQINIADIRSKWVGKSEKNIAKIFKDYKKAKKSLGYAPILLFNEADALFNNRIASQSSTDMMNNSMQNILLENLENFDGILFATTNLTLNLDDAFERRFLFRLEFKKPKEKLRAKIWRYKLKHLSDIDIAVLAKYDLSGADIENICKKYLINAAIAQNNKDQNNKDIDLLNKIIAQEKALKHKVIVGFNRAATS